MGSNQVHMIKTTEPIVEHMDKRTGMILEEINMVDNILVRISINLNKLTKTIHTVYLIQQTNNSTRMSL